MPDGPGRDEQAPPRPPDTFEAEQDFKDRVETLGGFAELNLDHAVALSEEARSKGETTWVGDSPTGAFGQSFNLMIIIAIILIIAVAAFYFTTGSDLLTGLSDEPSESETAPVEESASEQSDPAAPATVPDTDPEPAAADEVPAHFVGTIVSDNGWFTVTVAADGSASGSLDVFQMVDGGTADQAGSFAGSIGDGDVVTCSGTYTGVSTDEDGNQFPHGGTVSVIAAPTSEDRSTWQIDADGEPGEPVTLPAHAE